MERRGSCNFYVSVPIFKIAALFWVAGAQIYKKEQHPEPTRRFY